jgi:hypothetical protein
MGLHELVTDRFVWGFMLLQLLVFLYMREQGVSHSFDDDEKKELFSKLPQEGSQDSTDWGTQRGLR